MALNVGYVDNANRHRYSSTGEGPEGPCYVPREQSAQGAVALPARALYYPGGGAVAIREDRGAAHNLGAGDLLKRLGTRANVPHCHPHTFRRTFALWSLRAGMDIFSLQKLMGECRPVRVTQIS